MGVREETLDLLRSGKSPGLIAEIKRVNPKTTLAYLDELVGRGILQRSDIFFAVARCDRDAVLRLSKEEDNTDAWHIHGILDRMGKRIRFGDVLAAVKYGDARFALGDMYEDIREIEIFLHRLIRSALQKRYGAREHDWWRQGVPLDVRQECQSRREEDEAPVSDPYCYTDILHLRKILDKQWDTIKDELPPTMTSDKKRLLHDLIILNNIRRNVMHPVRGISPSEDDFEFVRGLRTMIREECAP